MSDAYKNKNDYSCIVFEKKQFLAKYTYVGNLQKFVTFLNGHSKFKNWTALNVYERRTGNFIVQYNPNSPIHPKPKI